MRHAGKTGAWEINQNPKPIPSRRFDWDYAHEDYDGPGDNRVGCAESLQACIEAIRELEEADE